MSQVASYERRLPKALGVGFVLAAVIGVYGSAFAMVAGLIAFEWAEQHLPFVHAPLLIRVLVSAAPPMLLPLVLLRWLGQRYGRVEVRPLEVGFHHALNPKNEKLQLDRRGLEVVRVTPHGIECADPQSGWLRRTLDPLVIPVRDPAEQEALLRQLLHEVPEGEPQDLRRRHTMTKAECVVIGLIVLVLASLIAPAFTV